MTLRFSAASLGAVAALAHFSWARCPGRIPTTHPDSSFPTITYYVESRRSYLLGCMWLLTEVSPGIEVYHPESGFIRSCLKQQNFAELHEEGEGQKVKIKGRGASLKTGVVEWSG